MARDKYGIIQPENEALDVVSKAIPTAIQTYMQTKQMKDQQDARAKDREMRRMEFDARITAQDRAFDYQKAMDRATLKSKGMIQDDSGEWQRDPRYLMEQARLARAKAKPADAPKGYRWNPDGSLEPIPGGPVAEKHAQTAEKKRGKQQSTRRRGRTLLRDARRALELSKKGAGGPLGAQAADIPIVGALAPAYELGQHLESIKSNISIDELQNMRENSPTGGALGQVPVQQQEFLMSVLGSLKPELPEHILQQNLQEVSNIYLDAMYGSPKELEEAVADGRMTKDEASQALNARMTDYYDQFGVPTGVQDKGSSRGIVGGQGRMGGGLMTGESEAGPQSPQQDPKISDYAKKHNLDYQEAEQILGARGYGR